MNAFVWYDVYTLIDPFEKQAFYVGITDDLIERYIQHIKMRDSNEAKNAKIAIIIERGCLPIIYRVLRVQGQKGAFELEALWIDILRLYRQPLTNRELKLYKNNESRQTLINNVVASVSTFSSDSIFPFEPIPTDQVVTMLKQLSI